MKIRELFESVTTNNVYYHGTNETFDFFSTKATRVHRGTNVEGIYFTPYESEAKSFGRNVIKASLSVRKTFSNRGGNVISSKMLDAARAVLKRYTHHPDRWIDEVILPKFQADGNLNTFNDFDGSVKRDILLAGGYDSFKDGEHVVILSPTRQNIKVL